MQSHGVRCVRLGVLLAVHEGDQRSTLLESVGMHILGQEAVVEEKEITVAVGHAGWCSCWYRSSRWDCCSCHDYRLVFRFVH